MLENSLNKFKKDFNQAFIDEFQGKYVALVDGNAPSSYLHVDLNLGKFG